MAEFIQYVAVGLGLLIIVPYFALVIAHLINLPGQAGPRSKRRRR